MTDLQEKLLVLMMVLALLAVGFALGSFWGYEGARAEECRIRASVSADSRNMNLPLVAEPAYKQNPRNTF